MAINRNILFGTTGKIDPRTGRVTGLPQQQPRQPVIGQAQAVQGVAQPAIPALPSVTQPQAPVTQPTTPQQFNAFGAPTGFTFGAPQQPPSPIPTAPPAPQQPDVMQGTLQGLEAQIRALQGQITGQQGEQAIRGREEDILRGIRISPEEQDIQQRLNALLSRTELGRVAVQEKPIAAPFITGQLAAIQRQATVQAAPFQRQLALEQGKRQAALGRAGVALDIEQARRQRERERVEEARPNEIELDTFTNSEGQRVTTLLDRNTGKVRRIVSEGKVAPREITTTVTERTRARRIKVIKTIDPAIDKFRRPDGTVPLVVFQRARKSYARAMGETDGFDDLYLSHLNAEDRARFAGKKVTTTTGTTIENPFK